MKKDIEQPDGMGGIAAVVLCTALMLLVIFVPARKGALPGGKISLTGVALMGISWGVKQIQAARAQYKKEVDASKKEHDRKDA